MSKQNLKGFRQGELLFIPVTAPEWAKKQMNEPLATKIIREGEVTGHKHEIEGNGVLTELRSTYFYPPTEMRDTEKSISLPEGTMFLTATNDIVIKHPEHKDLKLKKGDYVVRIQREYDEMRNRNVMD
jgi:hypothetical protein